VFLCAASKIRLARNGCAPTPEQLLPAYNRRGKELVLQIAVGDAHPLDRLENLACLFQVACQGLFDCQPFQRGTPTKHLVGYRLDKLHAHIVGCKEPDGIHLRVAYHVAHIGIEPRLTHTQLMTIACQLARTLQVPTGDGGNLGVANAGERLGVKSRHKTAADKTDS
jgi:hypothetical protein